MSQHKRKLLVDRPDCTLCGKKIANPFRTLEYCEDCQTRLQEMHLNGEDLYKTLAGVMPPSEIPDEASLKVQTFRKVVVKAMRGSGLITMPEDDEPKRSILVG